MAASTAAAYAGNGLLLLLLKLLMVPLMVPLKLQLRILNHALWMDARVSFESLQPGGQDCDHLALGCWGGEFAVVEGPHKSGRSFWR